MDRTQLTSPLGVQLLAPTTGAHRHHKKTRASTHPGCAHASIPLKSLPSLRGRTAARGGVGHGGVCGRTTAAVAACSVQRLVQGEERLGSFRGVGPSPHGRVSCVLLGDVGGGVCSRAFVTLRIRKEVQSASSASFFRRSQFWCSQPKARRARGGMRGQDAFSEFLFLSIFVHAVKMYIIVVIYSNCCGRGIWHHAYTI